MENMNALGQPAFQTLLAKLEYSHRISICWNIMSYAMSIIGFPTIVKEKGISVHILGAIDVDQEL
jgi:hypothetical protein